MSNSSSYPPFETFAEDVVALDLPFSASEVHGLMCAFIATGALAEGERYLQTLVQSSICSPDLKKEAARSLFFVFNASQQQIVEINFEFDLLLPSDNFSLIERSQAFSDWCNGFLMGLKQTNFAVTSLEPDAQESLEHLGEFAQLDCDDLDQDEDNEKALVEIHEYVRMVVLRLSGDIQYPEEVVRGGSTEH